MINFLKRFLWPSRISQESVGTMLLEQRQELLVLQNRTVSSAEVMAEITTRLDALNAIQSSLETLQKTQPSLEVLQPHLFDIQYAVEENTKAVNNNASTVTNELAHKNEATESAISALSNKVSDLSLALDDINQKTISTDLSPVLGAVQSLVAETQLTVKNSGFENRNLLLHELSTQQTNLTELKDSISPVITAIDGLSQKVEQEALNTQNKSDENRNLTIHEVTTNSSALNAITNKVTELSQNFNETTSLASVSASPADFSPVLMAVQNLAAETKLSVTNSGFESRNIMMHEITTQQTDIKELKNAIFELGNALHTLDIKVSHESVRQSAEIVSAFSGLTGKLPDPAPQTAPPPKALSFDQALGQAQKDNPKIYPLWFERLEELKTAFDEEGKHGNAANAADAYSNVFKSFVEGHARGAILDVGCGVHGKPHYLHAFPDSQIAGLDPLEAIEPVGFVRHTGIGEYLPWENESFDTIISATAIDHVLSLDKSFEEMARLLKPGGQVLMWVGSVDGSKKYTPHAKNYEPADRFHLFHIDKAWFEPELEKYFHIGSQINLWLPQHEHIFYQLTAK